MSWNGYDARIDFSEAVYTTVHGDQFTSIRPSPYVYLGAAEEALVGCLVHVNDSFVADIEVGDQIAPDDVMGVTHPRYEYPGLETYVPLRVYQVISPGDGPGGLTKTVYECTDFEYLPSRRFESTPIAFMIGGTEIARVDLADHVALQYLGDTKTPDHITARFTGPENRREHMSDSNPTADRGESIPSLADAINLGLGLAGLFASVADDFSEGEGSRHDSERRYPRRLDVRHVDDTDDLVVEIPGAKREDISVKIEDDTLKITVKDRGEAWIAVGDKDDRDAIAASYVDGVLTVRVPRIIVPVQEIEIGSEPLD